MANMINDANRLSPFKSIRDVTKNNGSKKERNISHKVGKDYDVSLTNDGKFFATREVKEDKGISLQSITKNKWNVTPEEEKLSPKAKEFLAKLREQYGDYEFLVADNVDNPLDIAGPSDKSYFVMLSTEEIERMAEDEEYANKVMGNVDSGVHTLQDIQESGELGEGVRFSRLGISFDADGNMKLFAELERFTEKQEEIRQEAAEKREEDKKLAARDHSKAPPNRPKLPNQQELMGAIRIHTENREYPNENAWKLLQPELADGVSHKGINGEHHSQDNAPVKTVRLQAGSVEELMELIKNINWDE